MVSGLWCHLQAVAFALAEADEPPKSLLERLDPETRGKAMMALFGLAVLGVGLILLIMMGGHLVRRLSRERSPGKPRKAWYQKPLEADEDEDGENEDGGDDEGENRPGDDA